MLKQIRWLAEDGFVVDSVGRGPRPPETTGEHFEMKYRPLPLRVLANALLPNPMKNRFLVASTVPRVLRHSAESHPYDVGIVNEIEMLAWMTRERSQLIAPGPRGRLHLDLHEFAPSQQRGLVHRLLFRRYRLWLVRFIASRVFTSRSVVSPGIADLYARWLGIPAPAVIRSCPDYVDQRPSPVGPGPIRLVHHGNAASIRGLHLMIEAMDEIESRFTLDLMLVGASEAIAELQRQSVHLGDRVTFRAPVDVRSVPAALNEYDLEIIFFPPVTENLRHTLPNKLFEAIQGRLGVIIGRSPDMVELTARIGNAVTADGWKATDLARAINSIDSRQVEKLKQNSDAAAGDLSSEAEKRRFLAAVGL